MNAERNGDRKEHQLRRFRTRRWEECVEEQQTAWQRRRQSNDLHLFKPHTRTSLKIALVSGELQGELPDEITRTSQASKKESCPSMAFNDAQGCNRGGRQRRYKNSRLAESRSKIRSEAVHVEGLRFQPISYQKTSRQAHIHTPLLYPSPSEGRRDGYACAAEVRRVPGDIKHPPPPAQPKS